MPWAAQYEPGSAVEPAAALLDAPATAHAQVAPQDTAALEGQEEILALRLDRLQEFSVEAFRDPLDRRARMRRLDLDALADERLERPRGAVERVPLGH